MSKMTLEQVRDWHRKHAAQIKLLERTFKEPDARAQWHTEMADAIDERIKADEGKVQSARERVEMAMREPNAAKAAQVASELGAAHRAISPPAQAAQVDRFDMLAHLRRQREWSGQTFGPGSRAQGVVDHIRKELCEVESDPGDLKEWIDVVILALDGAWRSGAQPQEIIDALVAKQTKNEGRVWPDWRTSDPNKAIEHDRSHDVTTTDPPAYWVPVGGIRPGAPAWPGQMDGKAPPDGWVTIEADLAPIAKPTLGEFVRMPDAERVAIGQQVAERVDEMTVQPTKLEDAWTGEIECCDAKGFWLILADDCPFVPGQRVTITAALQENAK